MRNNRMPNYIVAVAMIGAMFAIVGVPLRTIAPFAILLACPLMMIIMMRGMGGNRGESEDHTGHGCEHDPTNRVEPPARQPRPRTVGG